MVSVHYELKKKYTNMTLGTPGSRHKIPDVKPEVQETFNTEVLYIRSHHNF